MAISAREPGLILSAATHAALLAATLVAFSDTAKFDEAQESVPVEIVTDQQFNQIAKGEQSAKAVQPRPRIEKEADKQEQKPLPPLAEARKDTPVPPPPLKRIPDPGEDDKPETAAPPERVAAAPPPPPPPPRPPQPETPPQPQPRPEALKPPAPAKAEEKPEPDEAEPVEKKPPPRPKDLKPKETEAPPQPPEKPKVEAKPKEPPKPKFDEVAKLLEQKKREDQAKAEAAKAQAKPADKPKPASRPRSGEESDEKPSRFDPTAIARALSHEAPQRTASTGRERSATPSQGAPTASAARMSPSMWGQLDGLLQEQYKRCWSYFGTGGARYIPQVRVSYSPDGALIGGPSLVNPPSDPNMQSLAESALRAVRRCNPLRIPAQFQPYYAQWKSRIVRFDPEDMN